MARTRTRSFALLGAGFAALAVVAAIVSAIWIGSQRMGRILGPEPVEERCEARAGDYAGELAIDQAGGAALIAQVARERGLPARAVTIGLATAMQESGIRNLDYGDRDSLGMFQQRPSQGWGSPEQVQDPVYATNAFFNHLVKVKGYESMEITVAAQAVQRSGYPDAYAQHEPLARSFAAALTGQEPAALTCIYDPGKHAVGNAETLAKDLAQTFDGTKVSLGDEAGQPTRRVQLTGKLATEDGEWAAASWLLIHARQYGINEVQVGTKLWRLATGEWEETTRPGLPRATLLLTLDVPASPAASASPP